MNLKPILIKFLNIFKNLLLFYNKKGSILMLK